MSMAQGVRYVQKSSVLRSNTCERLNRPEHPPGGGGGGGGKELMKKFISQAQLTQEAAGPAW